MRYMRNGATVLALETSCDESAVAILRNDSGKLCLLANLISSQVEEHSKWGGVVPEIASRRHLEVLPSLLEQALSHSSTKISNIDAIASTVSPGLTGALMVGSVTARTLAALHQLPFLGIHHLEGHLASVYLDANPPEFPYLVLLVSGGHTELIHVKEIGKYELIGRSHDDAAGEAFDKVARLLGLPYPGGPAIQSLGKTGNPKTFKLPKGKVSKPGGGFYPYDFSFSGLKTAMLRQVQSFENNSLEIPLEDLAASFENIVAEVLVERSLRCAVDRGLTTLVLVGGVAANQRLREMIVKQADAQAIKINIAPKGFCTDNAAMIGAAALKRLELGVTASSLDLGVCPRWPLDQAHQFYKSNPPF